MVALMRFTAVLLSVLGLTTPGVLADAFFVPLDGSNKFVPKPAEFGYKRLGGHSEFWIIAFFSG